MELTLEEVKKAKDGTLVGMSCQNCEGHETHKKLNTKWVCQWCGNKKTV